MEGDILIRRSYPCAEGRADGRLYLVKSRLASIPKEGNPPTYAVLENGIFTIKDFEGNTVKKYYNSEEKKEKYMEKFELIAPCHFGMEAVLKREILNLK